MQEELTDLRERVNQLEAALSSANLSITAEALKQSQHRLSFVVQRHPLGVIEWSTSFEVIEWNPAAEAIFGYTKDEVMGHHAAGLLVPESARSQVNQVFATLLKQDGGTRNINENLTKDGRVIICEWYNTPLIDWRGQVTGALSMVEDITKRKEAQLALEQAKAELENRVLERTAQLQQEICERQQTEEILRQQALELQQTLNSLQRTQSQLIQSEKMSSLGQLVAGVAHEINNPVNFIYGNLTHAKNYTEDLVTLLNFYQKHYPNPVPEILDQAEAIDLNFLLQDLPKLYSSMKIGATRIREIVASLRTFSRLDEAELKEAEIHEGIDSTLMLLEHRLQGKPNHPEILVIKEYGNLPLVECYAGQLNQVFMNILANAIDALEEGVGNSHCVPERSSKEVLKVVASSEGKWGVVKNESPTPQIRIRTEISSSKQVVIRIADNGPGMSEQVQKQLFDPFYTTKPIGKGTGLGMSISYQIVTERHRGSLQCISSPGKGAEFVIEIPICCNP